MSSKFFLRTKTSAVVGPRRPLGRDNHYFDYDYDSDDDWEEEEQVIILTTVIRYNREY